MNRLHVFKRLAAIALGVACHVGAHAAPSARQAYETGLKGLQEIGGDKYDETCAQALQKSWGRFSGDAGDYRSLEQRYLNGAAQAAVCAVKYGYIRYLWLGDVETAHADPAFARKPLRAQTDEANRLFGKRKVGELDGFLAKVTCNASTPHISLSGYFTQVVDVACSTPLGPATVDLSNLRVTVGGKNFWNGPDETYYGRNFYRITGTRP